MTARTNLKGGGGGGGGFPLAEIGLNCHKKKLYTVRKRLVDFGLLINFIARKFIFIVLGDWENLTGNIPLAFRTFFADVRLLPNFFLTWR